MNPTVPAIVAAAGLLQVSALPVRRVIVYKNGVAYYERSGAVKPGEAAALDFKAAELDDVLKSLVLEAPGGIARVRYEFREPAARKAKEAGVQLGPQQPLAVLLDQWRGARVEMNYRGQPVSGVIVSGRLAPLPDKGQKQELTLMSDSGELGVYDLDAASGIRLSEPRLQRQLADALAAIAKERSPDRSTLWIDLSGSGEQRVTARYLAPAPVWKSAYRLLLPGSGEATLEGWAIVENATGEDWEQVSLSVVSGKPVSFLTRLSDPRFIQRKEAELPGIEPAAPQLHAGAMAAEEKAAAAPASRQRVMSPIRGRVDVLEAAAAPMEMSSVEPQTQAREAGELFEYNFSTPVSAKKGEALLLPFFQGKIAARKLVLYSDRSAVHPRHAAEITNTSGKTLDGGPITVYSEAGYAGEALVETLKDGEKRLISYAVDQGTRITTNFESGEESIRSIRASRGVLVTRTAVQRTTVYTASNADAKEKTLLVEHPVTPGWKLISPKAEQTTPNSWRFAAKLPAKGGAKLAVVEEHEVESSTSVSSLTPDVLVRYVRSRTVSPAARQQLEAVIAKKREISETDNQLQLAEKEIKETAAEQERLRQNINTLRNVAGQQEQVNRYAAELARTDARIAELQSRRAGLRARLAELEIELNALIEKLEF